jgi:hypothetical protein
VSALYPIGARSSLESPTKLDRAKVPNAIEGRWVLNLYPGAAEATGWYVSAVRSSAGGSWWEPEPDRSAAEAARRARARVRRYCVENRLNRLGTLTYGPPFCRDPRAVRGHVGGFFRRLRTETGPLPYLWVPELHEDGERYHLHFGVGQFVHWRSIRRAWPHGFIHIKLIGDLPVGSGTIGEARVTAGYLGKYVGKALEDGPAGLHRYEVAQGFQPLCQRIVGTTLEEVLAKAAEVMGSPPAEVWDSATVADWAAPHSVRATWAG